MSQTHSSERDSASRIRTRVVSPRTLNVSASAVDAGVAEHARAQGGHLDGIEMEDVARLDGRGGAGRPGGRRGRLARPSAARPLNI